MFGQVIPSPRSVVNIKEITNADELILIKGGATVSGSYINALVSSVKIVFEIGKSFGTAIRRTVVGKMCPL